MPEWDDLASGFDEHNERDLTGFIERQRWFAGKGRPIAGLALADLIVLSDRPRVLVALVEVRDGSGTSEVYQLPLGTRPGAARTDDDRDVTSVGGSVFFDATAEPAIAELFASSPTEGLVVPGRNGEIRFQTIRDIPTEGRAVRRLEAEQSNTSVVLNEQLLVKLYRRLEAGTNPELEVLLFLTEHGFENVPRLAGWYSYVGTGLRTTLGLAEQFIPNAVDGWNLGLAELTHPPGRFLERLGRLGEVVGDMHRVLSCEHDDLAFAPESPTDETAAILCAKLEAQIEELSAFIPDGRAAELVTLTRALTEHPIPGQLIRSHGDLHLGQVLWTGDDWLVIDFEGEPARSLAERRQKLHPLRDVAGLLRSFSYLAATVTIERGAVLGPDFEQQANEKFLTAYRARVAPAGLLPNDLEVQEHMLQTFELEKMLYELGYELHHRPDWVPVPLAGIERLLSAQIGMPDG